MTSVGSFRPPCVPAALTLTYEDGVTGQVMGGEWMGIDEGMKVERMDDKELDDEGIDSDRE